ncbi:MAG: hypothetical protein DRJ05_12965 [Bacteroidetes bacterium]|nr:MAG: hypothetical protein DRJ05_12965 [Bacteroidota bacterium]
MGNEPKIEYLPAANENILEISIDIEIKGYPITAEKFKKELFGFGNSLVYFPEKYPFCRKPSFFKKGFRCAIYKKNYIFIYKPFKTKLVVYNVIHVSSYVY